MRCGASDITYRTWGEGDRSTAMSEFSAAGIAAAACFGEEVACRAMHPYPLVFLARGVVARWRWVGDPALSCAHVSSWALPVSCWRAERSAPWWPGANQVQPRHAA